MSDDESYELVILSCDDEEHHDCVRAMLRFMLPSDELADHAFKHGIEMPATMVGEYETLFRRMWQADGTSQAHVNVPLHLVVKPAPSVQPVRMSLRSAKRIYASLIERMERKDEDDDDSMGGAIREVFDLIDKIIDQANAKRGMKH